MLQGEPNVFLELLRQLEAEHARQVEELRDEVERLRNGLEPMVSGAHIEPCDLNRRSSMDTSTGAPFLPVNSEPEESEEVKLQIRSTFDIGPLCQPSAMVLCGSETVDDMPTFRPQLLKVTIFGAKGLPRSDWGPGGSADPYCECSVRDKPGLFCVTPVAYSTLSPVWNHVCVLSGWSAGDVLEIHVKDHDVFSADDLIGRATLDASALKEGSFDGELQLHGAGDGNAVRGASIHIHVKLGHLSDFFQPKSVWKDDAQQCSNRPLLHHKDSLPPASRNQWNEWRKSKSPRGMLDPSSTMRVVWDVIGILVLSFDMAWAPMAVFDPPQMIVLTIMKWFSPSYWTLDVCLSFTTGTQTKQGIVIMDRREVARRYFRGWFMLDMVIVLVEWTFLFLSPEGGLEGATAARAGKFLRVFRLFRVLRLMRLAKMRELLFTLQNFIESEVLTLGLLVTLNMMSILALNHVLACAWFLVGDSSENGWVANQPGLKDSDFVMQYLVSMQWTMAQFSPGASPVTPKTVGERIFSLSVLILGFVVATCFVSNITSTLSAVWSIKRNQNTQSLLLKIFLRQNNISRGLATRVTRYIRCVRELRQRKVHPSKVEYLGLLSGPLHVAMQCELREPQISVHPIFPEYKAASKKAFQELCTSALESTCFARNDSVFTRNAEAPHMYFITTGSTVYRARNDPDRRRSKLGAGHWCCENSLWMPWTHVGDMKAISDVDATMLIASKFIEVTRSDPETYCLAKAYCVEFMDKLQKVASFDRVAVTDLPCHIEIASLDCNTESANGSLTSLWSQNRFLPPRGVVYGIFESSEAMEVKHAEDAQVELVSFSDSESEDAAGPAMSASRSLTSMRGHHFDYDSSHGPHLESGRWSKQFRKRFTRSLGSVGKPKTSA